MEKNNLTKAEKIAFIVKTELEMLKDMRQGIKLADGDRHTQARKLIEEYRKELGLIRK
jgi:DnaJ-domain-containing protein 1